MIVNGTSQAYSASIPELPPCPDSPNCVSSQAQDPKHGVAPFYIIGNPEKAWETLKIALIKGRMVVTSETSNTLTAEATSFVFRFVDDINAVMDADAKIIHIRSASRTGYSDFGVNRRRIDALRASLQNAGVIK